MAEVEGAEQLMLITCQEQCMSMGKVDGALLTRKQNRCFYGAITL